MKRYLVPLDGSGLAERALPYLARLVEPGDTATLVSVEEILPVPKRGQDLGTLHQGRMEVLEKHCEALRRKGVKAEAILLFGLAAETVLHHAQKVGADTLVMSSHGRTGLGRILYGSVALKLLTAFPGEVIVIRPPKETLRHE